MRFQQQIVFILILLALQGKSFSNARQVVTTEKELAVEGDSKFSLQKEILPNVAKVETSSRVGGRKMTVKTTTKASTKEQDSNSKKVSMASSSAIIPSAGNSKGDEEGKWKDNFMALSADYRSPKSHPPKNN